MPKHKPQGQPKPKHKPKPSSKPAPPEDPDYEDPERSTCMQIVLRDVLTVPDLLYWPNIEVNCVIFFAAGIVFTCSIPSPPNARTCACRTHDEHGECGAAGLHALQRGGAPWVGSQNK